MEEENLTRHDMIRLLVTKAGYELSEFEDLPDEYIYELYKLEFDMDI